MGRLRARRRHGGLLRAQALTHRRADLRPGGLTCGSTSAATTRRTTCSRTSSPSLHGEGHEVTNHGPHRYDAVDDYPVFVLRAAEGVAGDPGSFGIVLGGSGNGEQMAANKVAGIRAALCYDDELARLAREHNDAQVLSIGARMTTAEQATRCSGLPRHPRSAATRGTSARVAMVSAPTRSTAPAAPAVGPEASCRGRAWRAPACARSSGGTATAHTSVRGRPTRGWCHEARPAARPEPAHAPEAPQALVRRPGRVA